MIFEEKPTRVIGITHGVIYELNGLECETEITGGSSSVFKPQLRYQTLSTTHVPPVANMRVL